jgi:hypothetical protein
MCNIVACKKSWVDEELVKGENNWGEKVSGYKGATNIWLYGRETWPSTVEKGVDTGVGCNP